MTTTPTDTAPADLGTVRRAAREHEVFIKILTDEPWQRCQHGKRIVEVMAHWSDDAPFTVTTGCVNSTQRFPRTVHADGTVIARPGDTLSPFEYNTVSRCPKCHALDTLRVAQLQYGDETTCTGCDYRSFYDIGD
jgi:hypothetical protein